MESSFQAVFVKEIRPEVLTLIRESQTLIIKRYGLQSLTFKIAPKNFPKIWPQTRFPLVVTVIQMNPTPTCSHLKKWKIVRGKVLLSKQYF